MILSRLKLIPLLFVVISAVACAQATPTLFLSTPQGADQLQATTAADTTVIDVYSPNGIGQAEVHLAAGAMPSALLLRLHLDGLEGFTLTYGEWELTASVFSGDRETVMQRSYHQASDTWADVGPEDVLWMDIRYYQNEEQNMTNNRSNREGYFELEIPANFLDGPQRIFSMQWIDYYR